MRRSLGEMSFHFIAPVAQYPANWETSAQNLAIQFPLLDQAEKCKIPTLIGFPRTITRYPELIDPLIAGSCLVKEIPDVSTLKSPNVQ